MTTPPPPAPSLTTGAAAVAAAAAAYASPFASTPSPPYTAVIFSSTRTAAEDGGAYAATAARMMELVASQPGYLGAESARGADGLGITVSYWRDRECASLWRAHAEHAAARAKGRASFYAGFRVRVATVEDEYGM
jgi:heme-degrading monooxygenase HmoA